MAAASARRAVALLALTCAAGHAQEVPAALGALNGKPVQGSSPPSTPAGTCLAGSCDCKRSLTPVPDKAVVTLITSDTGYSAGALAIASALEALGSSLRRIVLVTPNVAENIRDLLRQASWEVQVVDTITCNQVFGPQITPETYDIGPEYQEKRAKWLPTCTKFHAWNLTFLKKLIFLDADILLIRSIDMLIDHPSDFAAAPDTFPADQFNSGVMVITPDAEKFHELLAFNEENGSAEGGDQCLLNDFFSDWFYNAWDAAEAGRLPWVMNVAAGSYNQYKTLMRMQSREEPSIIHFVGGESKPWLYFYLKHNNMEDKIPGGMKRLLETWTALYWAAKQGALCSGGFSAADSQQLKLMVDTL